MKRVFGPGLCSMVCACALLVTGCGSTSPEPPDGASATHRPTGGTSGDAHKESDRNTSPAPGGDKKTTTLPVTPGKGGSAMVSRPSDGRGSSRPTGKEVTLTSYDATSGRAVVSHDGPGTPRVRKGDVVASPPTKAAPKGALFRVTKTRSGSNGKTEVDTAPASLAEALGKVKAGGTVAVPASAWTVDPLVKGLDVARRLVGRATEDSPATSTGKGSRPLRVGFDTELPMPGGKPWLERETEVGGFLEMAPKVTFSYDGRASTEGAGATASVKVTGPYKAGWHIKGPVVTPRIAPRIPIATLAAYPVVMAGPVPVVISLKLRLILEIRADGSLQVDLEQTAGGSMTMGTRYTAASGWRADTHATGKPLPGGTAKVSGKGDLRTTLGPEASIGLYDTVGIDALFGPYLRVKASHPEVVPGSGDRRNGKWKLYGGVTLESSLFTRLPFTVIGIRPTKRLLFPLFTREWPITQGSIPPVP
ncbi:hypothetical protein [Streptomyces sp. NPDC048636]|uniref:hypothetical protein n=1 Tax=Streptomyces sp. NPDC048636 TaxID=3155762 RepID=UPI00342CF431